MRRTLAFVIASLVSGAASAALYDPQVAWVVPSGKGTALVLANADGSRAVTVATSKSLISAVDFAPGGGRVAFNDLQGGIKVLAYTATNTGIVVNSVTTLVPAGTGVGLGAPDFSPDGTRLAYVHSTNTTPQEVRIISAANGAVQRTHPCSPCDGARWLRAGLGDAFAYFHYGYVPGQARVTEIWTVLVNGDGSTTAGPVLSTATQAFGGIEDFDVARTRDALLLTANYPTGVRTVEFDLLTQAITDRGTGTRAHFSADDSRIVRRTPHSASGDYVVSTDVATGLETRLTKKGDYGDTDARP